MFRTNNARRRFGLMASTSLVASTLTAGLGGVALTAFTPAVALANCNPDAPGGTIGTATVPGAGPELCGGTDTGVFYKGVTAANGLTVVFIGETVNTSGAGIASTQAANLTLAVDSNLAVGGAITNTAGEGVAITSAGGNVEFESGELLGGHPASAVNGSTNGIDLTTTGAGNITIGAFNDVSATSGSAILANAGSGNIKILAESETSGNINLAGGIITAGGNNVSITQVGQITAGGFGISNFGGAATGDVTISSGAVTSTGQDAIIANTTGGNVSITTHGDTTAGGAGNFGISAINSSAAGNTTVTTNGNTTGILAAVGTGTGVATVNVNGNVTGTGVIVSQGIHGSGTAAVTANINLNKGNVSGNVAGFSAVDVHTDGPITIVVADGVNVSGAANGVGGVLTQGAGGASLSVGKGSAISGSGAVAVSMTGTGAGNLSLTQATADQTSSITATGGVNADAVTMIQNGAATGGINVNYVGNISSATGNGVVAWIQNAGSASDVNLTLGNVAANLTGVFAENDGAGNVSVTTIKGTKVSAANGDGIDAFAMGGGNVVVTLLDGSVEANTSGLASGPFATGPLGGAGGPSGPSGPTGPTATGIAKPIDPNGVNMIAVNSGTVTLFQNSDVANKGAGDGIRSTAVDGSTTLNINANITNAGGNGVKATNTGDGAITINLFNDGGLLGQTQNAVTITTDTGSGILATATGGVAGSSSANIDISAAAKGLGPNTLTIGVTKGATGVGGIIASNTGSGHANIDLTNVVSGNITVEGAGANVGLESVTIDGNKGGLAGTASVTTGANLTLTVGSLGGNGDIGIESNSGDGFGANPGASIKLGDSNIVTVGTAAATGSIGILATSQGTDGLAGDGVSIVGGNLEQITANGGGAIGVEGNIGGGPGGPGEAVSITFGDGGAITAHDTALDNGIGILAVTNSGSAGATVNVSLGNTSVTSDFGVGIKASTVGANSSTVSTRGNITAGQDGIDNVTASGDASNSFNSTGTGSATMKSGGAIGVNATVTSGAGNATDTIGNGVGTTTITMTNTTIPTIGVEASAGGSGTASIVSNGGVTVDPTEFGMESKSVTGPASISTGTGDSYTVSDPGVVAPEHIGLYAHTGAIADVGGVPSANISIGANNTISVGATFEESTDIGVGAFNVGGAKGGAAVTAANGLNLTVGGNNAAGIVATTIGTDGGAPLNASTGVGDVGVHVGTGNLTVGTTPTFSILFLPTTFAESVGEFAATNGGNVSVSNGANITVQNAAGNAGLPIGTNTVGILARTVDKGNIDIGAATAGTTISTQVGDGIEAVHSGGGSGTVTVGGGVNGVVNENITTGVANLSGFAAGNGIEARTDGNGAIIVNQGAPSTITTNGTAAGNKGTANIGILAINTAGTGKFGDISVTADGNINTAAGGGNVDALGNILQGGQGVLATTNGNGNITVTQAATGNIQVAGANSDGIDAVNTGNANGNVTVTVAGVVNAGGAGISALTTSNDDVTVNLNSASVTSLNAGAVNALNINAGEGTVIVTTTGATTVTGNLSGILAETNGAGVVNVTTSAATNTSSSTGTGIIALNIGSKNSGDITVDNEGAVTNAGTIGIDAETTQATNNADVHVTTGSITSVGDGVLAQTAGTGDVDVTVNALTNGGATLIKSTNGAGVEANALDGGSVKTTINGVTEGIEGTVDTAIGTGSVTVNANNDTTGTTGDGIQTKTVDGTNTVNVKAGTTSSTGADGVDATTSGNGSIKVVVSTGANVVGGSVGGTDANDGVFAQVGGTGTIGVTVNGNVTTLNPGSSWGVQANGNGGDVTITEGATGQVLDGGIQGNNSTLNGGEVTVNLSGFTNDSLGDGVETNTTTGTGTVNLFGTAKVTATDGGFADGVSVFTTSGPANISSIGSGTSVSGDLDGLHALTNSGPITILEDGTATGTTGSGIHAESTTGKINVTTGTGTINGATGITTSIASGKAKTTITTGTGTVTGTTADGIHATTGGSGAVTVVTNGATVGQVNGILATSNGGVVTVTNNGTVTGTTGKGIDGETTGTGTITINVNKSVSDAIGIFTSQPGSGETDIIDTSAANTVTGTVGDGIQVANGAGTGLVNIGSGTGSRFFGPVTGATNGIDVVTSGAVNVFTANADSGAAGWGVSVVSQNAGGPITINTTGAVTGTGGGGILATDTNANAILVTTSGPVTGLGAGSDGVQMTSTGAGNVELDSTSSAIIGAHDAVKATSAGGTITIGTLATPIPSVLGDGTTLNGAIETSNTTGSTSVFTGATASMAGDVNAQFGISSTSTTGSITINNQAQIGSSGVGSGVANVGIHAAQSAASTKAISITNNGAIFSDGTVKNGGGITATADSSAGITVTNTANITVASGGPRTFGIEGVNTGTGAVLLSNTATIDPPTIGMKAVSGGNATVTTSGNVTGTQTGLVAITTGGAAFTATADVTGGANVTGINHDGIFAGGFSGNVVVDTTAGGTISGGNNGIQTIQVGGGTTNILTADAVTGLNGWGITAQSFGGGAVTVKASAGGAVTGTNGGGIRATTNNASAVTVTASTTVKGLNAGSDGIDAASTGAGNVLVTSTGPLVTGANDAILAASNGGSVQVGTAGTPITSQVGDATTTNAGIEADNTTGTISVVNHGNMSADGNANYGILAQNTGAGANTIGITNTAQIGATGAGAGVNGGGILATETNKAATGTITITNSGNVFADTNAAHTVTVGFVTETGTVGVGAMSAGNANINITNTGQIDPPAFGILAVTLGNIGVSNTGNITAITAGIDSISFGGGNVSVTNNATALNPSTVSASNGDGLDAASFAGNGNVSVTATQSIIEGTNNGIIAWSNNGGSTLVTTTNVDVFGTGTGSVNGGTGPIALSGLAGTGGVAVGAGTSLKASLTNTLVEADAGRAIVTNSGNNAEIDLNGSTAIGLGDATHAVIDVTAVSGATTTINSTNGLITSVHSQPTSYGDLAILGTTGSVVVNNGGTLFGRINTSAVTGTNNTVVNNGENTTGTAGFWETTGTSTFDAGADTINNGSVSGTARTGTIITANNGVATTFAFGAGTDTVNNTANGTIVAGTGTIPGATSGGPETTPAVTSFTGLETFTNNGLIVLGGTTAGSDGKIDSVLLASGSAFGGTGLIDLDANLWSDSQVGADCIGASLKAADCLVIGSSSGNNAIRVKDTGAHTLGAFNPTGIAIVSGSSGAATFHLDSGSSFFDGNPADAFLFGGATNVLNKPGMFFYDLLFDSADSTERLVGIPKATAFEFASVGGAVDNVWYMTTQTWFDRTTDQRDIISGRQNGSEPAVWLKAVGDWAHRNQSSSVSFFGTPFTFNTSYNQDTGGLLGGVDLLNVTDKNQAWVFGVEAGTVDSNMRFTASPDTFDITATDLGAYVTYLNGGLFVDGTINANFLRLTDDLPSLGITPPVSSDTHGTTVGGQIEGGYSFPLGASAFWEPLGTLAYVSTNFGDIPVPGGTEKLDDAHSFRGSLGARLGLMSDFQYYKVKLSVTGRVWDEFDNDTQGTLIVPGGPNFINNDNLRGVFGEVSGQANLFTNTSGLSAFLTGGVKFKSNYTEGQVTLGARYQF